ncbi:soluble quino protein glucose dehydrogenase [Patellaria atrata CBS 101060]|uniref:Soluble quino protein glucose dehydrogenase n=1 Tax=Patellaria atrata CBS 101060 TaxID=1346257 RepID=A0A9P4S7M2_9PEZI|nr:soluble quino protein glucose dehydrogenase [Patellaria atrata CBS 101060]
MAPIRSLLSGIMAVGMLLLPSVVAQCQNINPANPVTMASGYQSRVILNGLRTPRGIIFDNEGNLLVVEQGGAGVRYIKLTDNGGINVCVQSSKQLINDAALNHGIALSVDGKTLFVSSRESVFSYPYDGVAGTVGTRKTLISGMSQSGAHLSRTLLIPRSSPDTLLVSRGSQENIDQATNQISGGRSMIRMFSISQISNSPVQYTTGGELLGWGLRNSVGVGENPADGGIWSVENSVDDMRRLNQDVHNDNPGEELNYHGILNDTASPERGGNYGYPKCFAAWNPNGLPSNQNIRVGTQFLMGSPSGSDTDAMCANDRIAPRLTFPSHTAPLDVRFKADGSAAFISFHGSWNRQPPDGYRLSRIEFSAGQPREPPTSTTAAVNIMWNANNANCPYRCFRPVGLAFDRTGRLFMTSDQSNEIFVITGA